MRVQFLLGPAGSGKTFRCLAEVRARLMADPQGPPLVLLAPRQATFQLERALLATPGLRGYTRLRITSFDRFAAWLLDRLGQPARPPLSDEGRVMVLRALLHQQHEALRVFRESSRSPGFAQQLSGQLRELQEHRVSPATLRAAAARITGPGTLAHKLHDLAGLLEHYLAWLRDHQLQDAGTLLDRAVEALDERLALSGDESFRIAGLWLDGLAELTPQELRLLCALVPVCDEATLAFCLEDLPKDDPPWRSNWSVISRTFRRCHALLAADERCEIQVEVLGRDPQRSRFASGDTAVPGGDVLFHLEAHWTAGVGFAGEPGGALTLTQCGHPEQEAVMAAREVLKFVRAGNRFRDCAVLLRRMETHHAALRRAFTRYQIPFFLDRRQPVAHHPLAEFTRSALHTVLFHWRLTDWFAALKSGLTALPPEEVDQLENIALARGWEGAAWLQPLEIPDDPARGRVCESQRLRVIDPFRRLRDSLGDRATGRVLASAVRRLWEDFAVEATLESWSTTAPGEVLHLTVLEELQAWLDNLELAFGDYSLPLRDWLPILEAGLGALSVGAIPPCLDQVLIGAVDRSRNPDLKLAIVLGLNEGVFPLPPDDGGLLTETDRLELGTAALPLRDDAHLRLGHERYLGYIACTRARERLVLAWSERNIAGQPVNRSPLVDHVQRLFPAAAVIPFNEPTQLAECLHASELLGPVLRGADCETTQVDLLLPGTDAGHEPPGVTGLRAQLAFFAEQERATGLARLSDDSVRKLFGPRLETSASRLERFAACPFQHFVSAGLRARERDRFEVDARKTGTFLHEVLRHFHEEVTAESKTWRQITPADARERIARIGAAQLDVIAAGVLGSQPRHRFRAASLIRLLQEFVATVIGWMASYQFDPLAVELSIGGSSGRLPWWEIDLGEGRVLAFRGSVDRVDATAVPGGEDTAGLTVMDYKSGNKTFESLKMRAGLQLQLPAYLAALCEVADGSELLRGRRARPAGMFYVRLKDAPERVPHRLAEGRSGKRFEHTGRFSLEWLPLFDRNHATGGSGQFNYRLKKDGQPYANSHQLIRQPDLEQMLADAREMLRHLGREILAGNVAVDPYRQGTETPCTHCEFKAVCRMDPWTHTFRPLRPVLGATAKAAASAPTDESE